jgi:hypothetical protein
MCEWAGKIEAEAEIEENCLRCFHHHLSPVDSLLLGREPPAEAFSRFWSRVIRIPTAAPLMSRLPFPKGDVCDSRQRDSDGSAAG